MNAYLFKVFVSPVNVVAEYNNSHRVGKIRADESSISSIKRCRLYCVYDIINPEDIAWLIVYGQRFWITNTGGNDRGDVGPIQESSLYLWSLTVVCPVQIPKRRKKSSGRIWLYMDKFSCLNDTLERGHPSSLNVDRIVWHFQLRGTAVKYGTTI